MEDDLIFSTSILSKMHVARFWKVEQKMDVDYSLIVISETGDIKPIIAYTN
jgi:hypothetical protein